MTTSDRGATLDVPTAYASDGFFFPVPVFSTGEVAQFRDWYFEFRGAHRAELADDRRTAQSLVHNQTHLLLDWIAGISANPAILDLVELLIGPDIALWHSQWIVKMPHTGGLANAPLPWHQDEVNYVFEPPDSVTAWVALSEATPENGGMQFIPRSHANGIFGFQPNGRDERSPVTRGGVVGVDTTSPVDVVLRPGQISLHHPRLVHASGVNMSDGPRIGLVLRYVSTQVRSRGPHPVEGTIVRGSAPSSFTVLDPTRVRDRSELQRRNLRHMEENAATVGY